MLASSSDINISVIVRHVQAAWGGGGGGGGGVGGDLLSFSVPGETEKNRSMGFAWGYQYPS